MVAGKCHIAKCHFVLYTAAITRTKWHLGVRLGSAITRGICWPMVAEQAIATIVTTISAYGGRQLRPAGGGVNKVLPPLPLYLLNKNKKDKGIR